MSSVVNEYKSIVSEENALFINIHFYVLDLYKVILSLPQVKGILWQVAPLCFMEYIDIQSFCASVSLN